MTSDILREQALAWLDGRGAHMDFDEAVAAFPAVAINRQPPGVAYTPWHLLEHLRLTQRDILDYVRDPQYQEPPWPLGYWPAPDAIATPEAFAATIAGFRSAREALRDIIAEEGTDLLGVLPNTPGHTLPREIRLVADHNAYHIGEFAILRQVMGTWPSGRGA